MKYSIAKSKEELKRIIDNRDNIKYPVEIPIIEENEKNWKLFNYNIFTLNDVKELTHKLISDEFPDLKSDKPILYAATYSLIMAIFTYFINHESYEKQNNIFMIKKLVDAFNEGDNKKDNQQAYIFDKLKSIDIYDDCLFYYDTFLINPEEICLNAVSLFSYICNKYIDENKLREYIRTEKEKQDKDQKDRKLHEAIGTIKTSKKEMQKAIDDLAKLNMSYSEIEEYNKFINEDNSENNIKSIITLKTLINDNEQYIKKSHR